ncbi:MAG: acyl carrier protein [Firmicutes bacterium]|nr:acyl carrier protein [Bacillota bacterium]
MSDEDRLEDRLKEIILDYLDLDETDVSAETPLEAMVKDSLDILELAVQIEEEFDVELDDEELQQTETFGELVEKIMAVIVRWG